MHHVISPHRTTHLLLPVLFDTGSATSSSSQLPVKFKAWRILLPRQAFSFSETVQILSD
jgi:hypothetical protein